jgi:hypothetical protein
MGPVSATRCGCSLDDCARLGGRRSENARDWYEPHEANLKKFCLPWFFFVDPRALHEVRRRIYDQYFMSKRE